MTLIVDQNESEPKILYHCPCSSLYSESKSGTDAGKDVFDCPIGVNSPVLALRTFPLSHMYFCDDCGEIRCPRCVLSEPAGYYCSNCLFEVPTASVRSEKNRCARNCFECPACTHVLSVMEAESRSDDAPAKPFYLSCSVCFWDSREIGWCFEKATGLSAQVEALKSNTAEKEFNQLVEHFEGIQKSSLPNNHFSSTFGSLGYSSRSLGRFSSFGMSTRSQLESRNGKQSSLQEYHAVSYVEDSDLASPTPNIQNMIPTRVRLAMKQAKRCRKCRHIMIKPESKAQTIRFKIKLVASNYIPKITLLRTLSDSTPLTTAPYPVNEPFYIGLRFTNPIYTIVNMELSTPFTDDSNPDNPTVDLIASTFALPPYTELWEYEDEEDEDLENKEILAKANNSKGVVEVRGNSVSVIAYVVAKKPSENMILPILVKYNHKSLDVDLGEDEAGDVNDSATSDAAAATAANAIVYGSFWVYINLGRVSQQE